MQILKWLCLFVLTASVNLAFANVPVVDAYQQADSSTSNVSADNSNQPSGIDLSQTQNTSAGNTTSNFQNSNLPLDQRVQILEKQAANNSQLLNQMNNLQEQIQELRGQLETETHALQALQDQSKDQYKDLDQRLSQAGSGGKIPASSLGTQTAKGTDKSTASAKGATNSSVTKSEDSSFVSGASASVDTKPPVGPPAPPLVNSKDQSAYQTAFSLLKAKKYEQATSAFQDYLSEYPSAKNNVNAHYWLGQLYLLQGQPDNAIDQFKTILQANPGNNKIPDTMVQLGLAYYAKGDIAHAKAQLTQVQQAFPDSPAAKLAKTRLQQITQANPTTVTRAG